MLENLKQQIEHLNRAIANFEEADANFKGIESNEYFKLMPSEKPAEVKALWAVRHACRATLIMAIKLVKKQGDEFDFNDVDSCEITLNKPLIYDRKSYLKFFGSEVSGE